MSRWACGRAAVAIRQVSPEQDLPALGDFFAGLSLNTRYLRFFGPIRPVRVGRSATVGDRSIDADAALIVA